MSSRFDVPPNERAAGFALEPAAAPAYCIGKIETVVGACTLTRPDGITIQIKPGDTVYQGDIIATSAGGRAAIRFIDGTVFNLSDSARMAMKEFASDGASPSALFDVSNGTFSFIAGEMAKAGRLDIDTPFASIRGRTSAGGIGMLSLASLFFAAMEQVQAQPTGALGLDNGVIALKDLTNDFGAIELQLKTNPPQTIWQEDPAETIIVRGNSAGSVTVSRVAISIDQMIGYASETQHLYSLGQGPAGVGTNGSSSPPLPPEFQPTTPIFIPPAGNGPAPGSLPGNSNGSSGPDIFVPLPPPPPLVKPDTNLAQGDNTAGNVLDSQPHAGGTADVGDIGSLTVIQVQDADENLAVQPGSTSTSNGTMIHGLFGTLTIGANGSYNYVVDSSNPAVLALAQGASGQDVFTYTATDGTGTTASTTLSITVPGVNDAPLAVADTNVGDPVSKADPAATGNVLTNDTDVDTGDTKAVIGVASGTPPGDVSGNVATTVTGIYGSVQIAANGTWTYTLDNSDPDTNKLAQGAVAHDVFTYTMQDANGATSTTTLDITITGTNDAPVAVADTNAGDLVTEAGVNPGNTPFAGDPSAAGNVLTNDTDVDTGDTKAVIGVASGTPPGDVSGNVATTVTGIYGSVQIAANGTWTYTLDNSDPDTNELAQGAVAHDVFTYTMQDANGATSTTTLDITITGTNDAPIAVADVNGSDAVTKVDPSASGNVLTNDTDVDVPDTKTVSEVNGSAANVGSVITGTYGKLTLSASGSWTYNLDNDDPQTQALPQNASAQDVFTYTVTDSNGATSSTTLTITVTGTNEAPVAVVDVGAVTEAGVNPGNTSFAGNASAAGNVLTNDTDVDTGDTKAVIGVASGTPPGDVSGNVATTVTGIYGSVQIAANGTWTYTLDNSDPDTNKLAQGAVAHDVFTYTMQDANGATSTTTLDITITGTNDAPVAVADTNAGDLVTEAGVNPGNTPFAGDPSAAGNVLTNDTDVDTGDTKAVIGVASGTPPGDVSGNVATTVTGIYGSVQIAANGTWTYTLDNSDPDTNKLAQGAVAHDVFTYTMQDANGATSTTTLDITITGTNDAPVAVADTNAGDLVTEAGVNPGNTPFAGDPSAAGNVLTNDTDVDTGDTKAVIGVASGTPPGDVSGNVATTVTGIYGSVQIAANGTWTYTLNNSDPDTNKLAQGAVAHDVFTYTMQDANGATSTTTLDITITGTNDAPIAVAGAASVSEEGLPGGIKDTIGSPDTTDSVTASGTISATDAENDTLTYSLGNPGAVLTSGGAAVTWQGVGTNTLIGKVGSTDIISVTIDNSGHYTVTLKGPVDQPDPTKEDAKTFTVPVNISDGHATTATTLSVSVEDDSPQANLVSTSIAPTDSKTNVVLMLDLSGSMDDDSGLTGLSRLDVAKAAINELLEQYDNRGDVMVRLVTFSDSADSHGGVWMTVAAAKTVLAGLAAGGSTNYDAALLTAMSAFASGTPGSPGGPLTGPGTQNVSYFLSDGAPTVGSDWPQITGTQTTSGIQANEQAVWDSFLTTNKIISYAIGVGSGVTTTLLSPIAFDPAPGAQLADTPIVVTDLSQLASTLAFSVPPISGAFVAGINGATDGGFGADGGHMQSVTVDNVTYTFNATANTITTSGPGAPSFNYVAATHTLTIDTDTTAVGGELAISMTTGAFTFQPTSGFTSKAVGYVLVDNDGDTDGNVLTFTAAGVTDHAPIVRDDHVITNISGSGAAIAIPSAALLYNDTDADGNAISVTATSGAADGSVSPSSGSPIATVTFTDNDTDGGSFVYTGSTSSPSASDTGNVTVTRVGGTTLTGTDFGEILIGRDGTNNTINANGGNDVLIGGTGNDTLNGGAGNDLIIGGAGADTMNGGTGGDSFIFKSITDSPPGPGPFDVITDFTHNVDHIDLSSIAGATIVQGLVGAASTVAANSISWFVDNAHNQTILYVNTTVTANHVDMEIHLTGTNINLTGADILHHT